MSGLPTSVARDLTVYRDAAGRVLFGAGHVDLVVWLEASFPDGVWVEDEDGRPLYTFGAREGGLVTLKSPALPENAPTAEETSAAVNAMRQVVGRPAEGASANPEWEKLLDNARGYSPRAMMLEAARVGADHSCTACLPCACRHTLGVLGYKR